MILSVILVSILVILFSTLSDQTFDLWQQLELASELESDLQDTRLGQELILMLEKLNLFRLTSLLTQVLMM